MFPPHIMQVEGMLVSYNLFKRILLGERMNECIYATYNDYYISIINIKKFVKEKKHCFQTEDLFTAVIYLPKKCLETRK